MEAELTADANSIPIIVHVPHSAIDIPADVREGILLEDDALNRQLLMMTDWYTDEMIDTERTGVTVVRYSVSRLVVDPERFRDDEEEMMAEVGMGAVYTRTLGGTTLRRFDAGEREALLQRFYDPHHRRMNELTAKILEEHVQCLILDLHSFPAHPLPYELNQSPDRPDICIGKDDFHSPDTLVVTAVNFFEGRGFAVKINEPFAGVFVPSDFYQKEQCLRAIMVEVNRSLYMNEVTGEKAAGFEAIEKVLTDFASTIVSVGD